MRWIRDIITISFKCLAPFNTATDNPVLRDKELGAGSDRQHGSYVLFVVQACAEVTPISSIAAHIYKTVFISPALMCPHVPSSARSAAVATAAEALAHSSSFAAASLGPYEPPLASSAYRALCAIQ